MQFNELQIEKDEKSTRWILPNRELGDFVKYGWVCSAFGLIAILFMTAWIATPLSWGVDLIRQKMMFGWFFILFAAPGLGGLFYGIRFLILGIKIKNNRSRLELAIRNNKLVSTEKLGWLDWSRKVHLNLITELKVDNGKNLVKRHEPTDGWQIFGETVRLTAKCGDNHFLAMIGYSEELTLEVANQLSAAIGKSVSSRIKTRTRDDETSFTLPAADNLLMLTAENMPADPSVPVTIATDGNDPPTKPITCSIVVHEKTDGTTAYEVPKVGVVKGSHGIFAFSIVWLVFCSIFFACLLFTAFKGGKDLDGGSLSVFGLVIAAFTSIGVVALLYSIDLGTRTVLIGVTPNGLSIKRKSIFGTKWLKFDRDEVVSFDVGPSGQAVNEKPINELKILHPTGKQTGLLRHLCDDELDWLAYYLSLNVGIKPIELGNISWQAMVRNLDINDLRFPASSRITMNENPRGLEINIPSQYISKGFLFMTFVGFVFAAVGVSMFIWTPPIPAKVFGCLFFALGLVIASITIFWGTRSFKIRVESKRLEIDRTWLLGIASFAWERSEIESIDMAFSGTTVNSERLYRLIVRCASGNSTQGVT